MIVITGDTQRPSPQVHNIEWLYHLVKYQVQMLIGESPSLISETKNLPFQEWVRTDETPELTNADLHIGFELNRAFKKKASLSGKKYIDVVIHPVRFMDDLMIGVSSNFLDFSKFRANEDEMFFGASQVCAAVTHIPGVRCEENTALVVGQTVGDKSVIFDREYSLDDFAPKLIDKLEGYDLVLYKPHPHNNNFPEFFRELSCVDKIQTNIYKLLSMKQIKHVYGLSSSVLAEAKYFQKESTSLLPTWWDHLAPVKSSVFLSFDFWRHCLGVKNHFSCDFDYQHSMLRKSARSYWGYDLLDKLP